MINDIYLHLQFIKNFLQIFLQINHRCLKELIAQFHSDLYYNELAI